jgi:uncharacterized membrane protein YhhN
MFLIYGEKGMTYYPFIFIFIVLLGFREIFTYRNNLMLKYLLTPLVTFSVIITAMFSLRINNDIYIFIIIAGLIFSLIGDTILMIEEKRFFIHGLLFFLLAQISYASALAEGYRFQLWNIIIAFPLLICIFILFKAIRQKSPGTAKAVLVYMMVISAMVFFAFAKFNNGVNVKSCLLSAGATLFLVSDIILAVNEFIMEIPNSSIFVWLAYAPAQFLIGLSCYYI